MCKYVNSKTLPAYSMFWVFGCAAAVVVDVVAAAMLVDGVECCCFSVHYCY